MSDFSTRQTNAIWTSPSGKVFELKTNEGGYKRKHEGEIKTTPQDTKKNTKKIADSSDTFLDMGVSGKSLTLDCLFVGDNHDIEAQSFEDALCETGKSRLKLHYGKEFTVNVIEFSKKYSVIERINATTVSVNFHQTANTIYPQSTASKAKNVKNMALVTNTAVAQNIADIVSKNTGVGLVGSINNSFSNVLNKVSKGLNTFNNTSLTSIISDVEAQVFTNNAFTMVSQLQQIMFKAASATTKINDLTKMSASSSFGSLERTWNALINDLTNTSIKHSTKLSHSQVVDLAISDMAITSAISAIANAAIDYNFETKKEAMQAAIALVNFDEKRSEFINKQESKIEELNEKYICDSGISELVNTTADAIIEKSFDLKIERKITLSQDASIIELAHKYYSKDFKEDPEKTIDFLISSNSLVDDEFFLLKRGTELKLYV